MPRVCRTWNGLTRLECSGPGAVSFKERTCIIDSDASATARVLDSLRTDRFQPDTHTATMRHHASRRMPLDEEIVMGVEDRLMSVQRQLVLSILRLR